MSISEKLQPQTLVSGREFERILVPLDGSSSAEEVIPTLKTLCLENSSHVILVRIVEPKALKSSPTSSQESVQFAGMYLRQVGATLEAQGILLGGELDGGVVAIDRRLGAGELCDLVLDGNALGEGQALASAKPRCLGRWPRDARRASASGER